MSVPKYIRNYLDEKHISYEAIHHRRDYTAQETAADTHTKGKDFAKTVLLYIDGQYCMAVLPATYNINMVKLQKKLNARNLNLATEDELSTICSDCEIGAMPPLGQLYKLPVYVDKHLSEDHKITFNAGTHEDAIRMQYTDFESIAHPKIIDMADDSNQLKYRLHSMD